VLSDIPASQDDRVLVDFRTADDAGVFRWEAGPAMVQTVDFFTPIVDDPYVYGEIAAANALSDVYAMGGTPLTALAIAAFPNEGVDAETIRAIFRGGFDMLRAAGVALLGGHTVRDPEIKFGYAVTGTIDPDRVLTNAGAQIGDTLFLTKPLGTGIVGTAIKNERAPSALADEAIRSMRTLNRAAADVLRSMPPGSVHACTDVTGFGLLGHGSELAKASGVTLRIDAAKVPVFSGVIAMADANRSGGLSSNQDHFAAGISAQPGVDADVMTVLYDPQTSGGLLVAVAPDRADAFQRQCEAASVPAFRIGSVEAAVANVHIVVRIG
jgi:selenide,water dikinase